MGNIQKILGNFEEAISQFTFILNKGLVFVKILGLEFFFLIDAKKNYSHRSKIYALNYFNWWNVFLFRKGLFQGQLFLEMSKLSWPSDKIFLYFDTTEQILFDWMENVGWHQHFLFLFTNYKWPRGFNMTQKKKKKKPNQNWSRILTCHFFFFLIEGRNFKETGNWSKLLFGSEKIEWRRLLEYVWYWS